MSDNYKDLLRKDLQELAENRGISKTGTKQEISYRLKQLDKKYKIKSNTEIKNDKLSYKTISELRDIAIKKHIKISDNDKRYDIIYKLRHTYPINNPRNQIDIHYLKKYAKNRGISSNGDFNEILKRINAFLKYYPDEVLHNIYDDDYYTFSKDTLKQLLNKYKITDYEFTKYDMLYKLRQYKKHKSEKVESDAETEKSEVESEKEEEIEVEPEEKEIEVESEKEEESEVESEEKEEESEVEPEEKEEKEEESEDETEEESDVETEKEEEKIKNYGNRITRNINSYPLKYLIKYAKNRGIKSTGSESELISRIQLYLNEYKTESIDIIYYDDYDDMTKTELKEMLDELKITDYENFKFEMLIFVRKYVKSAVDISDYKKKYLKKYAKNRGITEITEIERYLDEYPDESIYMIYYDDYEDLSITELQKIIRMLEITDYKLLKSDMLYKLRQYIKTNRFVQKIKFDKKLLQKIAKNRGLSDKGTKEEILLRIKNYIKKYKIKNFNYDLYTDNYENNTIVYLRNLARSYEIPIDKQDSKSELLYKIRCKTHSKQITIQQQLQQKMEDKMQLDYHKQHYIYSLSKDERRQKYENNCNKYIEEVIDILNFY